MEKRKKLHLELLRIFAIVLVIFNHTGLRGFTCFTQFQPSLRYWGYMALSVGCNISVPIFYMISGATLIDRQETPGQIWSRRIPRYVIILLLASLGIYSYYGIVDNWQLSAGDFFRRVYTSNIIIPYWYLYSYLGFLIVLPFLRRMIRNMSNREFLYLAVLNLLFQGVIPMLQYRLSRGSIRLNSSLNMALITSTLFVYPAMGYYLEYRKKLTWKQIGVLWGLSALALGLSMYMTHYKIVITGELKESQISTFYQSLRLLPVVTIYATAQKFIENRTVPATLEKCILTAGSCTFGIYLMEQILRRQTNGFRDTIAIWMPDMLATFVQVLLVALLGFGITWLLKRLPVIKSLL